MPGDVIVSAVRMSIAVMQDHALSPEITNINGGAIMLGCPLGCSGARVPTALLHELRRRSSGEKRPLSGPSALCIGVGQGDAPIAESIGG